MIKPSMILFDVGGTLFRDSKCNVREGLGALRKNALNPDITDDDTLVAYWNEYHAEIGKSFRTEKGTALEIPLSAMLKFVTMKAGLKFNMDIFSQEEIFDRYNSERAIMEGLPELLSLLKEKGIRTAVISNNAMSGEGLALALKRWLPGSEFEFALTSADLLFSKPHSSLFTAAANFAGLEASECWYCGDSKGADVEGSSGVGMFPVLINEGASELTTYIDNYLMIKNWHGLINVISEMN